MRKSERQIYRTREREREPTVTGGSFTQLVKKTRCKFSPSLGWVRIYCNAGNGMIVSGWEETQGVPRPSACPAREIFLCRWCRLAQHRHAAVPFRRRPNKREDRRREIYTVRVFMRFRGRDMYGFIRRRNV